MAAHHLFGHSRLLPLAIALGFMALEWGALRLREKEEHDLGESAASLGVSALGRIVKIAEAGLLVVPFMWVHEHRLLHFKPTSAFALVALFVSVELVYYWHHRASHRVRWLWATHSVHHSSSRMNFTSAIRLGWTGNISGNFLFFLPLVWLGFDHVFVLGMMGLNLAYQFFLHTELVGRLGVLEWVLNTPAHHRVHHASNGSCLDKNYGGILIVFDRLFGTLAEAPANEPLVYGLVHGKREVNPFRVALGEWWAMGRDFMRAPTLSARLHTLFAPPGSLHVEAPRSEPGELSMVR